MGGEERLEGFESGEAFSFGWRDPDSLSKLCRVAAEAGLLDGVEVLPLATTPCKREFLLTVAVADDVVLASERFTWWELQPPDGRLGLEAARHVLGRLDEIARRTRTRLGAYTWLRVASELEQVREILRMNPSAAEE